MAITVEKLENLRKDFDRYDQNQDGKLTVHEYEQAMAPYTSPETLARAIKELDLNNDSEINWFEFLADYLNDVIGRRVMTIERIQNFDDTFKSHDANKDGKVSFNELLESMDGYSTPAKLIDELNSVYDNFDADKDKQLTWNELFISLVRSFE